MFCSKCGSGASPAGSKFCIACGSTITELAPKSAAGLNICWNCGEGKQPVAGNCSKCGMNLAGEQSLGNTVKPHNNWKLVAIPFGIALLAMVVWGFSQGVSDKADYSDQNESASKSIDNSAATQGYNTDSETVAAIFSHLDSNGNADWFIEQVNDLVTDSEGVILTDQCAIWVYPNVESKNAAIDDGVFENIGDPYFWWDDDPSWYGVVLVAETESATCAIDAENALGWNLADFN